MPNANRFELETCLKDCLRFCDEHPDLDVVQVFHERFTLAAHHYADSMEMSDKTHAKWRVEEREEMVAWKQIASNLRDTQNTLRRMGAFGYPEHRVLYWDRVLLLEVVDEMITYLRDHADDIEWSKGTVDLFERQVGSAKSEGRDQTDALKTFQRYIDVRRESMSELGALIGEFRVALRRTFGKKDPRYGSIHWPYAIASDENILF